MSRSRWIITGVVNCPIRGEQSIVMCTCQMLAGFKPCESCGIDQDPDQAVKLREGQRKVLRGPADRNAKVETKRDYLKAKKRNGKTCCDCGKLITISAERCGPCSIVQMKKSRPKIRIGRGPKRGSNGYK